MNKYVLFIAFVLLSSFAVGQAHYPYQDIKLEKPTDYSETEPLALSAANFILNTAFVEADADRLAALQFLSKWTQGTKDYSFYLQGKAVNISSDLNVLCLFVAAMVKYTLENKAETVSPLQVEQNAAKIVLAYCNNTKNNFTLKKKYKKILETN